MNILAIPVLILATVAMELPAQTPPPPPAPMPAPRPVVPRPKVLMAPHPTSGSFLGVAIVEIDSERASKLRLPEARGVEVSSVFEGSPAEKAGLREGDVVLEFAGERVRGVEHFSRLVRETPAGRRVTLAIFRDGNRQTLTAEIGRRKVPMVGAFSLCDDNNADCEIQIPKFNLPAFDFDIPRPLMLTRSRSLGAELETVEGQIAEYFGVKNGVLVRSVESGSAAAKAGLKAGDVIVSVAGRDVSQSNQVSDAIRAARGQDKLACGIVRDKSKMDLSIGLQNEDAGRRPTPARRVRSNGGARF